MDQPAEQPMARRCRPSTPRPCRGLRIGVEPGGQHALGGGACTARAGAQASRSRSQVKPWTVRSNGGVSRAAGAKSICAIGALTPWTRKCPARSAMPADAVARRAGSRPSPAGAAWPACANGARQRRPGHAQAIGEPDQPLARADRGRGEIGQRQRAARLDHFARRGRRSTARAASLDQRARGRSSSGIAIASVSADRPAALQRRSGCGVAPSAHARALSARRCWRRSDPARRGRWPSRRPARRPRHRRIGARCRH